MDRYQRRLIPNIALSLAWMCIFDPKAKMFTGIDDAVQLLLEACWARKDGTSGMQAWQLVVDLSGDRPATVRLQRWDA